MSDIAKELFKSIVTDTASQEDFGSAIKQKMDQALDVRRAGLTASIYDKQVPSLETVVEESADLEEASKGDVEKLLKFAAKNGGKRKGNVVDFGGSKIEFSLDKGKIKFDGGKNSGVEHFDNLRDAMSALSIGMEV
tara:strand:- start:138 stop:545 length:408 start_codon:yes stop_codon:yes gene_type:complete